MRRASSFSICVVLSAYFVVPLILYFPIATTALGGGVPVSDGPTVRKDERWPLVSSEFGEISAVKISDGRHGCYHLHFITMDPHSLFLPVHLYSEMVFYVNSGNGTLSWTNVEKDGNELRQVELQRGDIYRLQPGTVFYLQNNVTSDEPHKLQIYAIFSDSEEQLQTGQFARVYASVHDLVLGFDNKVLQATLSVPEEVIEELKGGEIQPLIVQGLPEGHNSMQEVGSRLIKAFLGTKNNGISNVKKNKKNKKKAYSILKADHDVENCYGWSVTVNKKQLDVLKDSDFGVFMVNLTKGAMMGPHWNPINAEIAIVLHGQGMVHVVCPTIANETVCKNSRFRVEEGDVFAVPRYHPMVQISFNNDSFVFMGFTMTSKKNRPQYLAGQSSVFQTLDKMVLAKSFNVSNTTMDQVVSAQSDSNILECTSCAEEEERLMEEESKREREEGGGRQEAERGGESVEREEEDMEIRQREAEEVAARGRGAEGEGGSYIGEI